MSISMKLLDKYFIKQPALREFVSKIIYTDRDVTVNVAGQDLNINTIKENGYYRASLAGSKLSLFRDESTTLQNISSLIKDDSTFIDAGANIGIYASAISRISQLKKNVDIFAYEVDPDTYSRLKVNADRYGFRAINNGLSNVSGNCTFVRGAVSHVTTSLEKKNSYSMKGRTFEGNLVRLDDADIGRKPKFIKVDVEGAELEVLIGAEKLLKSNDIYGIYFDGISDFPSVYKILRGYGFSFYNGRTLEPIKEETFSVLALLE